MPATWRPRKPVVKGKPRIAVHLGNAGNDGRIRGDPAKKTIEYAKRFPRFLFIGIDRQPFKSNQHNWVQIKSDFKSGLEKLKDNTVDVISSEMAVGHYNSWGGEGDTEGGLIAIELHTNETIKQAYQKLKPRGKLILVAAAHGATFIKRALDASQFDPKKIQIREISPAEIERADKTRSFWTKYQKFGHPVEIIAEK